MTITTGTYEDLSDFVTEKLICTKCHCETPISGPLPKVPTCHICGSINVTRVNNQLSTPADLRAA